MCSFPYNPGVRNGWFQVMVVRDGVVKPDLDVINFCNSSSLEVELSALVKCMSIDKDAEDEVYYHGTDAQSAKSILDHGIDLTKSRGRRDFSCGYGFYITKNCNKAVEWANRKARQTPGRTGALVAFRIRKNLLTEKPHLPLEVVTASGREVWEFVVSHYRNGEEDDEMKSLLSNIKFITGPVSKNAFLRSGEKPVPYDFTQMCILNADYSKKFGSLENIQFVMFFSKN